MRSSNNAAMRRAAVAAMYVRRMAQHSAVHPRGAFLCSQACLPSPGAGWSRRDREHRRRDRIIAVPPGGARRHGEGRPRGNDARRWRTTSRRSGSPSTASCRGASTRCANRLRLPARRASTRRAAHRTSGRAGGSGRHGAACCADRTRVTSRDRRFTSTAAGGCHDDRSRWETTTWRPGRDVAMPKRAFLKRCWRCCRGAARPAFGQGA